MCVHDEFKGCTNVYTCAGILCVDANPIYLSCTHTDSVLTKEVSLFQRLFCIDLHSAGTIDRQCPYFGDP